MTRIQLEISDEDRRKAMARAIELGYSSVESYVRSLMDDDMEADLAPEIEAELLKALQSPAHVMRPADWDEMRRRLVRGRASA